MFTQDLLALVAFIIVVVNLWRLRLGRMERGATGQDGLLSIADSAATSVGGCRETDS
jgi:hypothetical protein